MNAESSYDWHGHQATVPLNFTIANLTKVGGLPISVTGGARYRAASSPTSPRGWGFRAVLAFLFPK